MTRDFDDELDTWVHAPMSRIRVSFQREASTRFIARAVQYSVASRKPCAWQPAGRLPRRDVRRDRVDLRAVARLYGLLMRAAVRPTLIR